MGTALDKALSLARHIERRGYETVIVGGAVRDLWLGLPLHDVDLATSASIETLASLFPQGHSLGHPPLTTFLVPWQEHTFEMVSWNGRGLRDDLARRDFTINAMALTTEGETLDPFCGREDLSAGRLRFNGPPTKRLSEDPVRAIRLARFSATLPDFRIPDEDLRAVRQASKDLLRRVPPERIGSEFRKSLDGDLPLFLDLLDKMGILNQALPEADPLKGLSQNPLFHPEGDVLTHTLLAVRAACSLTRDPAVRAAAMLHDIGKAHCASVDGNFYGHESVGADQARNRMVLWAWPKPLVDAVTLLVRRHMLPILSPAPHALLKLARRHGLKLVNRLFSLSLADLRASGGSQANWQANRTAFLQGQIQLSKGALPLSGHEVMDVLQIPEGPAVGKALAALEEAVADGMVTNASEAHHFLLKYGAQGFTRDPHKD